MADTDKELQRIFAKMCNESPRSRRAGRPVRQQSKICSLIEKLGYKFLVATLDLKANHFIREFPTSSLTRSDRQALKRVIEGHHRVCARCQVEVGAQEEWDHEFQRILAAQAGGHLRKAVGSVKSKRTRPKAVVTRASRPSILHR